MVGNYKVITLCGSTRFQDEFLRVQKELTLQGNIVLSVGFFSHSGDESFWDSMNEEKKIKTKEMLDDIHKRKIDMADEIFVINVGGYIGESTKSEIEYAKEHGKVVNYLENNKDDNGDIVLINLPDELFERDIDVIHCGCSDVYLFKENEINREQAGFRHDGKGNIIKDWIGDEFVVIGRDSGCGDPIITDISKEKLPVYFMPHDDWSSLQLIAVDFEQFLLILHLINKINLRDEDEIEVTIRIIESMMPEESSEYWVNLLQSGCEFLKDLDKRRNR